LEEGKALGAAFEGKGASGRVAIAGIDGAAAGFGATAADLAAAALDAAAAGTAGTDPNCNISAAMAKTMYESSLNL
jgi:hypothetical protein